MLGALSALVSREHYEWSADFVDAVEECFHEDQVVEFRLLEKLNLARLQG